MQLPEKRPVLYIGNKNLSSWSLRPWVLMKTFEVPFDEEKILLDAPDTNRKIQKISSSGFVPALHWGSLMIHDSLAICEFLAEQVPNMWPKDSGDRARARSIVCEMHSGFGNIRKNLSMRFSEALPTPILDSATKCEVDRIQNIWKDCLSVKLSTGGFLFGSFTIADAFFVPVVSRFRTYQIPIDPEIENYTKLVWALGAVKEWHEGAVREVQKKESLS